ncbi:jumonji domain containing 6, putative [Acanthamoeba castellanii str. Neff]|uniref:Jumonji domain containing 6, putative n=1 Tax=Acanthamoeba castellanii (strain ATCC 30010 / Neff) TaxID=1257118 RepID=L8HIQ1_ACACF|nr:jumonji domain containing 6, putative [Acanthamoeba castellanii str. Neff]ELR25075.1 jumonji domain containing 6, putative [Acanthamoeba castellanii str. Neff]
MAFSEYLDRVSWDERLSVTEEADKFPHLTGGWASPSLFGPNLYETIPSGVCPPFKYLIVSASGFGTPLHTEPDGGSTWLALLSGRKRWLVFPQDADITTFPNYHEDMSAHEFFSQVMWEGVQEPGEILYVPSGCAHVVLTLDASVAISVDFINDTNLPFIAPHLRALICPQ